MSVLEQLFPEKPLSPQWFLHIVCTTIVAYLLFDGIMVLRFAGWTSRIDLLGFLIPHASKVALWSGVALLWLKPAFNWRFPFAMALLYCMAELTTNAIYVPVHLLTDPAYVSRVGQFQPGFIFVLSNVFFIFSISFSYIFLRKRFSFGLNWSMLPFGALIGIWVATGYVTDSALTYAIPKVELEELLWSITYLFMMWGGVFRFAKS